MPPATADAIYQHYKVASSLMNEISYNRSAMLRLDRDYKNEIDRELNQRSAVTGRAMVGEIPEDLEPATPWNWHPIGDPMNYNAVKLIRTSAVKEKQTINGYTSLEKKLYQIVMQIGAPLAFMLSMRLGLVKNIF